MWKFVILLAALGAGGPALAQEASAPITFESCRVCHGPGGADDAIPAIAGRPADALAAQLRDFANEGGGTIMHRFVTGLTEPERDALAQYISGLEGDAR